jgi:Ku70/Ku80 beta-barrel domain
VPRDAIGQEAFAVIRDAMTREKVHGLGRVVLSSRERPMLVAVMGNGLCGVTLRFAHEVRKQAEYFSMIPEIKLPAEMVRLAQHIIETKSAAFDSAMLEDHYRNALVRILRKKQAKMPAPPAPMAPSRENVINLMDALRRSIAAEPPAKRPAAASKAARAKAQPCAAPVARMSRAFVKEAENETAELPDRPISPHRNFVTEAGLAAIEAALGRFEGRTAPQQTKVTGKLLLPPRGKCAIGECGGRAQKSSSHRLPEARRPSARPLPCAGMTAASRVSGSWAETRPIPHAAQCPTSRRWRGRS